VSCGAAGQQGPGGVPGGTWRHRPGPRWLRPAQAKTPGRTPRLPARQRRGTERDERRRRRVRPAAAATRRPVAPAGARTRTPAGPLPSATGEPGRRLPAHGRARQRRTRRRRTRQRRTRRRRTRRRRTRRRRTRRRRTHEPGGDERRPDEGEPCERGAHARPPLPAAERAPGSAPRRSSVPPAGAGSRGRDARTVGSAWSRAGPPSLCPGSARRVGAPAPGFQRPATARRRRPARLRQSVRGSWDVRDAWGV
jgi:hypothetical protein